MLQIGTGNRQALLAESEASFFQPEAPNFRIEFVKDADGAVTHVQRRHVLRGVAQSFTRR